jgi:tetratricopeptide (TPR) repeat protein
MRLVFLLIILFSFNNIMAYDIGSACCKCNALARADIKRLTVLIKKKPQDSNLRLTRGITYKCLDRIDSAYLDIVVSMKLNPKNSESYFELANLCIVKQKELKKILPLMNNDSGMVYLNKAISLNPVYADAYNLRGMLLFKAKNYAGAANDFCKSIENNFCCKPLEPYSWRCMSYLMKGNIDSAYTDYKKIHESPDKDAFYDEYLVSFFQNNYDEAMVLFNSLLQYQSNKYTKFEVVNSFGYLLNPVFNQDPDKKKELQNSIIY